MRFPLFNRAIPWILAGSVVLAGTACSRPDRTESGSNDSSTVLQDSNSSTVPSAEDTTAGTLSDTAAISADSGRSAAPTIPVKSNSPRPETAAPSETDAAGYRPMERDTANILDQHADSASINADTVEARDTPSTEVGVATDTVVGTDTAAAADTAIAGYVEMARDTSTVADQADSGDTADETADEQIVNPDEQERAAASEAANDEVGAAPVASGVTGAEAVAVVSRAGVRCAVVNPETNEAVRWDMSSTPVTLNPCGMGSMNLSKVWTAK